MTDKQTRIKVCESMKPKHLNLEDALKEFSRNMRLLENIAEKFRSSDIYFSNLPFEDKKTLNYVGKVIGEITTLLLTYKYKDEEEKLEVRRKFADVLKLVEKW